MRPRPRHGLRRCVPALESFFAVVVVVVVVVAKSSKTGWCSAQNSVLVPLTNSLYVRGELANADSVLVDVGTGFLLEKVLSPGAWP